MFNKDVKVPLHGAELDGTSSSNTFPLTNDSLRQICGVNTAFVGISYGHGIFPPNHIQNSMDNISIEDWGINKYNIKGSSIRKYFR